MTAERVTTLENWRELCVVDPGMEVSDMDARSMSDLQSSSLEGQGGELEYWSWGIRRGVYYGERAETIPLPMARQSMEKHFMVKVSRWC